MADISVDTDRDGLEDVIIRVASQLGLRDREHAPSVDVVVGGEYGSEGKGNIAFHLAPEYDVLVRVGGPNAAHKVYLASGEIFTHFSLPSGTQAGEARLVLGPGALVYPPELVRHTSSDRDAVVPAAASGRSQVGLSLPPGGREPRELRCEDDGALPRPSTSSPPPQGGIARRRPHVAAYRIREEAKFEH